MSDLISRQDAIKHIKAYRDEFKEDFGIDSEEGDDASHHFGYIAGLNRATRIIKDYVDAIEQVPSAQQWVPVTERLPEEDKEVLITYKRKGDELDKLYSNIEITTYGQMYFGGNKVGNHKHWRSPFQYFNDNYEVTAWMPLPEPYREDTDE